MNDDLPLNYRNLQRALQPPSKALYDAMHERWHDTQASDCETAAKRLARASGLSAVKCACGVEFPVGP